MIIVKYDRKKNVRVKKKKRTIKEIQCTIREKGGVHLLYIKPIYCWFISSSKRQFVFVRVFSLEWYLGHSFFNPKKWPQLLKSCNSLSLFVFLWWFFSNTVLVMMENMAVITLLEIRVLFDIFLVGMSFWLKWIKYFKIYYFNKIEKDF